LYCDQTDSAMWSDLLKVRDIYLQGRQLKVKDGRSTLFWRDTWIYDKPLSSLFPDLFKICEQPDISLYHVKLDPNHVTFTRWLIDDLWLSLENIQKEIANIQLTDGKDCVLALWQ